MAVRKKPAEKPVKRVFLYIGPSIRGVIQEGAIYIGETREEALKGAAFAIERKPLVKSLIVPAEIATQERIKVKTPGTALYKCRERLLSRD